VHGLVVVVVVVVVVVKVRMYVRLAQPYLDRSQCDTRGKKMKKAIQNVV
jgi:hypothetical protein